jgi:WD40 repeat protein
MTRLLALLLATPLLAAEPDYFPAVAKLIEDRCIDCHAADDPEGKLVLETHAGILKGGESGAALMPGKSGESLLIKYLRGEVEKDGKKKFMPPGKRDKLTAEEIEAFAKWIDAGAKPPQREMGRKVVEIPKVVPKVAPKLAVTALAFSPEANRIAAGKYGVVELLDPRSQAVLKRLEGHRGNVNALVWSADGAQLFTASGENAVEGEVRQWDVEKAQVIRTFKGHRDTIYALALSPDGQTLATGSYDQKIKLWNVADGAERKTLSGHNGAVFGLAFRPDGRLLASASADRTVKLWDAATGERRDTLGQPLKEQVAVAWSADGKQLAAAGADNRIRVWSVSAEARETSNPLLIARFAHEQPILRLAWKGDRLLSGAQDGSVKMWDAAGMKERLLLEKQPDWPTALVFAGDAVVVGRNDGSVGFYDGAGKAIGPAKGARNLECEGNEPRARVRRILCQAPMKKEAAPPKPEVTAISPRGIQRGGQADIALLGKNLAGVVSVKCADARVAVFTGPAVESQVPLIVRTPKDLPRSNYELIAHGADGKEVGRALVRIDSLPALNFPATGTRETLAELPTSVWGALSKPGESDRFDFEAKAGQTMVFDVGAKSAQSKADITLNLTDAGGRVLATSNNFDGGDPFLAHTFAAGGKYSVVLGEAQMGGGEPFFYHLTMGELPYVVGTFPLSVAANAETAVELIGYNLPAEAAARTVRVKAGASGTVPLPIDLEKFRLRAGASVLVSEWTNVVETGGNHTPPVAQAVPVPASVNGRIRTPGQPDFFKFPARQGVTYALETDAARRGSPVDTKIAVLTTAGQPIERLLLQAVRDSSVTFRPIDSATPDVRVENWREMELNELMWTGGEVNKIFRMPEGPDSGFAYYAEGGKRLTLFNTNPVAHALDEPCYIVEPHPPGARLVSSGLPVFTLHYENDDDGERELGTDSRVLFTAPADGEYLVRVEDSRGFGGERFGYRLIVREARPDFAVRIAEFDGTVNAGSGAAFTLIADRRDGFEGDIRCEISGIPAGWHVTTPLVIQSGHLRAKGCLTALPGVKAPSAEEWKAVKIRATADVSGQKATREVPAMALPKLQAAPALFVGVTPPAAGKHEPASPWAPFDSAKPFEFTIAPGEIIPAWMVVKRTSEKGALRFDVENLPHGVIVDNLGLNGITLLEGQDTGEIFFKAAPWVKEQDRLAFAVCREAGKQASLPFVLHVRHKEEKSDIVNVK